MHYLRLTAICLIVLTSLKGFALDTLFVSSTIKSVTIHPKGAYIDRSTDPIKAGSWIVAFEGLSPELKKETISLAPNGNIKIQSVSVREKTESPTLVDNQKIQKRIEEIKDSIQYNATLIDILEKESLMISKNMILSRTDGTSRIDEIIKASDFYNRRVREIALALYKLEKSKGILNQRLEYDLQKLESFKLAKTKNTIVVLVKVKNNSPSSRLLLKYYDPRASWLPAYDIKLTSKSSELFVYMKSLIQQTTKERWNNIDITLSTADANFSKTYKELNPYRIESNRYRAPAKKIIVSPGKTGKIIDNNGEAIISASIVITGTNIGTVTDVDGEFYLPQGEGKMVTVSYVGYEDRNVTIARSNNIIVMEESLHSLESVAVTGLGYTNKKIKYTPPKMVKQERKSLNIEINESITSKEYTLLGKQSIESDVADEDLLISIDTIPCKLVHKLSPVQNQNSYLLAYLEKGYRYDIENSDANLYIDEIYKGNTYIKASAIEEDLKITIGEDPSVIAERKWINNNYKKKTLSKSKEEIHHFRTTVKNNSKHNKSTVLKDQIPITSDDNIKIEVVDISGGNLDKETGIITWDLILKAGQQAFYDIKYKLKYPKHYDLSLN